MIRLILLSSAFLSVSFLSRSAHAETCGQLAGVRGSTVEILRMQRGRKGGDAVRFAIKIAEKTVTPLECDDVILSGKDSSAKILLVDGKLSLGSDSRIEIASHSKSATAGASDHVGILNLTYGKLRALVNRKADGAGGTVVAAPNGAAGTGSGAKGAGKSGTAAGSASGGVSSSGGSSAVSAEDAGATGQVKFEIKTFSAVAGVRGTDFYVSYDPNAGLTQQATIEGSVEVRQTGTNQKVLVGGGKQVQVDATPQAVREAQARFVKELPKVLPGASEVAKPLKVVAINEETRVELRQTSAAVSDDADFTTKRAVETLGEPSSWTIRHEALPDSLKKLKNEY